MGEGVATHLHDRNLNLDCNASYGGLFLSLGMFGSADPPSWNFELKEHVWGSKSSC